ncbi:hypothetical protein Scep_005165 [Stephania cephalantha]|uniref:Uncharacterized protein n=1 Tax=Stephania cephalantha TaxID=152367 RepID=A0AAP0PZU2_9MAGN
MNGSAYLAERLQWWNVNVFGNVHLKKKSLQHRINTFDRKLERSPTDYLFHIREELQGQMNDVLLQEEMLWYQKSRSQWLQFGDKNASFFHISTLTWRRKNRIERLRDDENNWIDDQEILKEMDVQFYKKLYSEESNVMDHVNWPNRFSHLNMNGEQALIKPVEAEEIKRAIFYMGAYKSLGPEGWSPIFFSPSGTQLANWCCAGNNSFHEEEVGQERLDGDQNRLGEGV